MKSSFKLLMGIIAFIVVLPLNATSAVKGKPATVVIQTSAICEQCKARIEKALKAENGIVSADLNLNKKKIKVKYYPDKITPDQIRTVISKTGYNADGVKRDGDAFNNLPKCCQKPGMM